MSAIKGGGRATISSKIEDEIISLLYDVRDRNNPLLSKEVVSDPDAPTNSFNDLSDHDKKKERKRFLKKLLKCHKQLQLSNRLNRRAIDGEATISTPSSVISPSASTPAVQTHEQNKGKVRIDIVEAIFKKEDTKKKTKKSSKSSSSSKPSRKKSWIDGSTRKTIVLPRSTSVKDLLKQCKAKLNMKKPTRVFFVDGNSKLEMDLIHDLSGLQDGDVVYATSDAKKKKDAPEGGNNKQEQSTDDKSEAVVVQEDPLVAVKKAYRNRTRNIRSTKHIPSNERLLPFQSFLQKLEPLSEPRTKLPAAAYREEILSSLDKSRVLIVCGATGCGKSTQVPQFILEGMKAMDSNEINIIVTQPRRVAATSLAKRVADERNQPYPGKNGSEIGYNVRLDKAVCKDTKLVFCTVGVLLRMMIATPKPDEKDNAVPLLNVSHVIIDEVHERDLTTDFALTILRPLLAINNRISVILMSATASSSLFMNFFRNRKVGIEPIVLDIPGRTFPVKTLWLDEVENLISSQLDGWSNEDGQRTMVHSHDKVGMSSRAKDRIDNDFVAKILKHIAQKQWDEDLHKSRDDKKESGAILIFLPGKGEIEALQRTLVKDSQLGNKSKCSIIHLHSSLSPSQQWRAFQAVKYGTVKIVLSTNVAETSITIPDISVVIDTGRVKEVRYNPSTRIKELVTVWTSQASGRQRAGRAGRVRPGICYKLYSEDFSQRMMLAQTSPEIVRTPLEDIVLQVCLLEEHKSTRGASPMMFLSNAPEPPPEINLKESCDHLLEIGALTHTPLEESIDTYRLTSLGYHLSHLPMDAKVGKVLIVGCILQCLEPALTIAAVLSSSKSCWLSFIPGVDRSSKKAREVQETLVRRGFGGELLGKGSVKGDLIAAIAAYNEWIISCQPSESPSNADRARHQFANDHALNHKALNEIKGLRSQFKNALETAGLLHSRNESNLNADDALLTSCCLVAGLYPNIATLARPSRERRIRFGFLISKNGDSCRASSSSFQNERIRNASESGKDAYAVYHGKHLSLGVSKGDERRKQDPFLSDVNFVSRFAILLFGGNIEVKKNYLVVDDWLKFKVADDKEEMSLEKVSDKGQVNAILISELRKELDTVFIKHIVQGQAKSGGELKDCKRVIDTVRSLLTSG